MDGILALILSCSLHHDDALVSAFIERVSDSNVYFVGDLATVTSHDHVQSLADALALVDEIQKKGGRPAVGLMAVPLTWAARYGRSPAELFDGCTNIAIGTDIMATFESRCTTGPSHRGDRKVAPRRRHRLPLAAGRACILRQFDLELGLRGYPEAVLGQMSKTASQPRDRAADSAPSRSRVFPDDTDEADPHDSSDWSNQRLYFLSPPAPSLPTAAGAEVAGRRGPPPPAPPRTPSHSSR
jgi:hypothetical protein